MSGNSDILRLLGRCLSIDQSNEALQALRQELGTVHSDWRSFIALANRHQITPALWRSLCQKECANVLPGDVRWYLAEIFQRNARRNVLLRQQVCEAVEALNKSGIQPVVLKGAFHLFD